MPEYVAERVSRSLNSRFGKAVKGAKVLVIGLSYKKDVTDTRESPAYEVIEKLEERGASISYYDPFVPVSIIGGHKMKSVSLTAAEIRKNDCVVIVTDHSNIDYDFIVENAKFVLDTRNALRNIRKREKIERL
jgi:UDP-N-acetyl-D-glucosamine dehydrogenase